jgi:hypothetical protein
MSFFPLPGTDARNEVLFADARSAADWLAAQPQANAPLMLAALSRAVEALNRHTLPARQRTKTLEVLRSAVFAASSECQRRYENKPLPLLAAENDAFLAARGLWRACRTGYMHCLDACLQGEPEVEAYAAQVAHRALACLRMEQRICYLASTEIDGDFWLAAHAVFAAAERLGVTREPTEDRLLAETSDSTVTGEYSMLLLLHLATPYSLTATQLAAATRWLARWREQAMVVGASQAHAEARGLPVDLTQNRPFHAFDDSGEGGASLNRRWLVARSIVRKMRQRIEFLAAGQTPEELKLGSGISAEACTTLLGVLAERLATPPTDFAAEAPAATARITVGLDAIYHLLVGRPLNEPAGLSGFGSRLSADQISVFGHVIQETGEDKARQAEVWQIAPGAGLVRDFLRLPAREGARLVLQGLIAVQIRGGAGNYRLAIIDRLSALADGRLRVTATFFSGNPAPLIAEINEKPAGKLSRHPAFLLPAAQAGGAASLILPGGLHARAMAIRFCDPETQAKLDYKLLAPLARGGDHERWSAAQG